MRTPSFLSKLQTAFRLFLLSIVLLTTWLYLNSSVYDFEKVPPFTGNKFYNPYSNWQDSKIIKANFHSHGISWSKLTDGVNSDDEMINAYQNKGYQLAGLSNYHKIVDSAYTLSKKMLFVPLYEHGYNITKSHALAIGAKKVSYLDYPLGQSTSHKQQIINNIRANGAMVALPHPNMRKGHTLTDATKLTNYQFVEVMSHSTISLDYWDTALNSGKPVWALSNDDSHGLKKQPIGRNFNEIGTYKVTTEDALRNLRDGNSIAVQSPTGEADVSLVNISIGNDTLYYQFDGAVEKVAVIADGTIAEKVTEKEGFFVIPKRVHYVRLEAEGEKAKLVCNPIVRFDGDKSKLFARNDLSPKTDWPLTFLYRIGVFLIGGCISYLLAKSIIVKSFK